ncbi:hypothetical protein BDA96_03G068000 [Sorghum bicolor]|uniref:Uncharacterized protein n=1 Tax=Sorghum bicolor TaxID=4558 RepID=A0A921RCI3_SORBI|nr:hypothetical protein BDA96_03G068000 [Sorghum bicolor]
MTEPIGFRTAVFLSFRAGLIRRCASSTCPSVSFCQSKGPRKGVLPSLRALCLDLYSLARIWQFGIL